jgi:hypothetical protein
MSLPRRLVDEGTDFERELLSSARLDVGPGRGFKKTLAAMSAMASVGTAAVGAGASVGGALGTAAGSGALVLVKWVGLGVVVGLGATGSTAWLGGREPPAPAAVLAPAPLAPSSSASPARAAPAPVTPAETSPADIPPPPARAAIAVGPIPKASLSRQLGTSAPPAEPLRTEAVAPRPSVMPASIDAEIGALADVRAALAARDARGALAKLAAYGRTFPNGALADEAVVLEVEALSLAQDRAAAADLARRFLASHPSSPHAPHLATVIAQAPPPGP